MITLKESIYNSIGKRVDRSFYNHVCDSVMSAVNVHMSERL